MILSLTTEVQGPVDGVIQALIDLEGEIDIKLKGMNKEISSPNNISMPKCLFDNNQTRLILVLFV